MKKKYRKAKPQPAYYYWLETDGCWDCNRKTQCGSCKRLKEQVAYEKEKRKRIEKQKLRGLYGKN